MIELTRDLVDASALVERATSPRVGAVLMFLGVTRQFDEDRETASLQYEAYEKMALAELARLESEARRTWPISECLIVHRLGLVPLGEASVAVVTASPHRSEAFAAGQWLIDTLKERVPIWKQEHWVDGTKDWVHATELKK
ncbi:MAG: molybdenum cofactor biosynthesis protein MoaE [Pirellulales bacterium]|nr:molybdenum cofactor biosynthesis protein MoaE [Pirellulales bacterium]